MRTSLSGATVAGSSGSASSTSGVGRSVSFGGGAGRGAGVGPSRPGVARSSSSSLASAAAGRPAGPGAGAGRGRGRVASLGGGATYSRLGLGLGKPPPAGTGTGAGPGTATGTGARLRGSMGPPLAPSAAAARASAASFTPSSASLGVGGSKTSPFVVTEEASASPDAIVDDSLGAESDDRRKRRASMALRSLVDGAGDIIPVGSSSPLAGLSASSPKDLMTASGGGSVEKKKAKKLTILKDCVVYVDVKTDDGSEAGEIFVNMLKSLGARVRLVPLFVSFLRQFSLRVFIFVATSV